MALVRALVRTAAVVAAFAIFASCSVPATEILFTLDTDAPTRGLTLLVTVRAGSMTVASDAGAGDAWVRLTGDSGLLQLPATFALVPRPGQNAENVTVVFDADFAADRFGDPAGHLRRVVRTAFTPHAVVRMPIFLSLACARSATGCTTVPAAQCTESVLCNERPGQTCGNDGTCVSAVVSPMDAGVACDGGAVACNGVCVDLRTSAANCGACGHACAAGVSCADGVCGGACPTGQVSCSGSCVDTQTDVNHCGACGHACTGVCTAGVCGSCSAGRTMCGSTCVDLQSDVANCGSCGTVCSGASATCNAGVCGVSCPSGQSLCSGSCRDLQTDTGNCGACGSSCSAPSGGSASCSGGSCQSNCPGGTTLCGGGCFDLSNDANHCGSCGASCGGGSVSRSCAGGRCVPDCSGRVDGLYCGNDLLGADANTLYLCIGGSATQSWPCSHGCAVQSAGTNDNCNASCAGQSNGAYCGNDGLGADPNTLFNCSGGSASVLQHCANGCHVSPPGVADYCN